jgi:hypothetical protein
MAKLIAALLELISNLFKKKEVVVTPSLDEIDLSSVKFDDKDISKWPITAGLSNVVIHTDGSVHATITGTRDWPAQNATDAKPNIGNWSIVAKCADGKYHSASYEGLKHGADQTVPRGWAGGDAIHGAIGTDFRPVKGDVVYFIVSRICRAAPWTGEARSPAIKAIWP